MFFVYGPQCCGRVRGFKQLEIPRDGDVTKELKWTLNVNCVTRNYGSSSLRTIVCNVMRVLYDCSELRVLRQTST